MCYGPTNRPCAFCVQISWAKKANLIFLFFLLRKLILPFYSFTLFCIILPMVMFVPEATLPLWVVCYIPMFMSFLKVLPSPHSFPFLIPYLLFENTMSVTKFNAMISGLFEHSSAHEWVVTKKTGRTSEADLLVMETIEEEEEEVEEEEAEEAATTKPSQGLEKTRSMSALDALKSHDVQIKTLLPSSVHTHPAAPSRRNRLYRKELLLAFLLLAASARSLLSAHGLHFYFLLFQGISFLVVGLDLIGEQVS